MAGTDSKCGLPEDHEDLNKVMIRNLKSTVTKEMLEQWLAEKTNEWNKATTDTADIVLTLGEGGNIKDTKIVEKTPHNFAFVTFTTTSATDKVIAAVNSTPEDQRKLQDNTVICKRAFPKNLMSMETKNCNSCTKKLFIANLPKTATREKNTEELAAVIGEVGFECPLGKIAEYQIVMQKGAEGKETEQCRGIAFVKLDSCAAVPEADKEKDRLVEHFADKLAIQFGNPFSLGGRQVDLKKNAEDGEGGGFRGGRGGRGGFRGGRGGPRGGRGGMGMPRGGGMMGGGYGQGAYGQSAAYDPYAYQMGGYDAYAAGAYGGQMAPGYGAGYGYQAGGYGGY